MLLLTEDRSKQLAVNLGCDAVFWHNAMNSVRSAPLRLWKGKKKKRSARDQGTAEIANTPKREVPILMSSARADVNVASLISSSLAMIEHRQLTARASLLARLKRE